MEEYSSLFVCLMGLGTVFFGLICLILLTTILGRICGRASKATAAPLPAAPAPAEDRQALVAAISAAIAEDLGTDISGIRILSMKKL